MYKIYKKNKYLKKLSQNTEKVVVLGSKSESNNDQLSFKQFQEFVYISTEKNKPDFGTNIRDEYMEVSFLLFLIIIFIVFFQTFQKVLFFGYIMVIINY